MKGHYEYELCVHDLFNQMHGGDFDLIHLYDSTDEKTYWLAESFGGRSRDCHDECYVVHDFGGKNHFKTFARFIQ